MTVAIRAVPRISEGVIRRILGFGSGIVGCSKTDEMAFWWQGRSFGYVTRTTIARAVIPSILRAFGVAITRILGGDSSNIV